MGFPGGASGKQPVCQCRRCKFNSVQSLSHVQLFATPWTLACPAPRFMEFSRQKYSSGLPLLSPGDLPNPRIQFGPPALQADSLPTETLGKPLLALHRC